MFNTGTYVLIGLGLNNWRPLRDKKRELLGNVERKVLESAKRGVDREVLESVERDVVREVLESAQIYRPCVER